VREKEARIPVLRGRKIGVDKKTTTPANFSRSHSFKKRGLPRWAGRGEQIKKARCQGKSKRRDTGGVTKGEKTGQVNFISSKGKDDLSEDAVVLSRLGEGKVRPPGCKIQKKKGSKLARIPRLLEVKGGGKSVARIMVHLQVNWTDAGEERT